MKRAAIIILSVLIAAAVIFSVFIPIHNNHVAAETEHKLLESPLPDDTEVIESLSAAGKLTGNGNGINFFGGILIKTGLSMDELSEFYSSMRETDCEYIVKEQTSPEIPVIEHGSFVFDSLKDETDFSGYYLVYSWGTDDSALKSFDGFDLRGH